MVIVRNSKFEELNEFSNINKQTHVVDHLTIKSLETHQQEFENNNNLFLSIILDSVKLAGYIILVEENDRNTVQLKRILINQCHLGIGKNAILAMENYCINQLKIERVWLDVFKSNAKAIHIYEKLGYKVFKQSIEDSREVLFYEKKL